MKPKPIPINKVRDIFSYDDGRLLREGGREVGWKSSAGYLIADLDRKKYLVHRLIWALHYDEVPDLIDHVDRDKLNNKIENLRASSKSDNNVNSGLRVDNKSGVTGVSYCKRTKRYEVYYKNKFYGRYNFNEACQLRKGLEMGGELSKIIDLPINFGPSYADIH